MKTRVLTGLVMAAVGIPLLFFSEYIIYPIAAALLTAVAVYEMMGVTGFRSTPAVWIPTYLIALAMPLCAFFFPNNTFEYIGASLAVMFAFMLYLFGYAVVKRGSVSFANISAHFMTAFYIISSFTALVLLRYIPNGAYCFGLVFIISFVCDSCAYFVGRAIGKHKLIPEVSPKKTVEGAIGGAFFTVIACLAYGIVLAFISGAPDPNYIVLAVIGLVLSVVSQFGDLIASLIKREHGIKDYGKLFPGHGGVLDRFDSILAVAPVLFAVCLFFPPFN